MNTNKLNIYCVGGAAINIGASIKSYDGKDTPGFAQLKTYFIDTSRSNLTGDIPEDDIYLVDSLDGSGKVRASNYQALSECSKDILHKFKPTTVNIVMHSGSGGTGSTLGCILVSEMLERDEVVIAIVIGGSASKIETSNTANTLKSYEMISKKKNKPVVIHYRENTAQRPRGVIDNEIQTAIMLLAATFSGHNRELDGSDLRNFINYDKVTSYGPRLSMLEFFSEKITVSKGSSLISVVTLVDDNISSELDISVEYQAVGFLPKTTKTAIELPIHIGIIAGYFNSVIVSLETKLDTHVEARQIHTEKPLVSENETHTKEGLIL
jgi:hypothetical protein